MTYHETLLFLRQHGYTETPQIHRSGDFTVLGDILLVWPVSSPKPYRLHFLGESLEKAESATETGWQEVGEPPRILPNHLETEHGTIKPGEYIVHPVHGVGIFEGVTVQKTVDGERVYGALQYAGNDRLLFAIEKQHELMPYIGSRHPRLTRLYSKSWQHTKERVQKNLIHVARELIKIYAARQLHERPLYPKAEEWLHTLEKSVDFSLTEDQERALVDITKDLCSSPHPMDRLLCGDVGFGKTEVALRAAAIVLASGKQVAFIAPTTILAEQHFALISDRFSELPVKVEHVSRLTVGNEKAVVSGLKEGSIDLVVGTHRLLGTDIEFKNLGLLIVDEEQKFGVAQKEKLKKIRPGIDVLSLSATPIPRTLSMSLSGLRGLSLLRTAPQGRLPIETTVAPYSDKELAEALTRELKRNGQAYVVHNRVQSLGLVEKRVRELLEKSHPNASIAIVHGQLPEASLAATMARFLKGEIDVLVASSIVEHGLDSPHANTLIVLHSEWFGLSDLYQLRGRVGRRSKQAYAHFFTGGVERSGYSAQGMPFAVSQLAKQRLAALVEADTLGSGWSIAMRDLEIRGGGNILGNEQSGSMEAVGLLLYAQLLQEEIGRQARQLGIAIFQKTE